MSNDDIRMVALLTGRLDLFVRTAHRVVSPGSAFEPEPAVTAMCRALQDVFEGKERRLLITAPPRTMKSFSASVCLPAFALGLNPALKFAVASYSQDLTREHSEQFRTLIDSRVYRALFPRFRLGERGSRIENIVTDQGGGRRPVTPNSGFTGAGSDFIVLDDLIKAQDAHSAAANDDVLRFYRETVLTRLNDRRTGAIISVQQRLHLDDIVSELLERGQYRHLNIPAVSLTGLTLPLYGGGEKAWAAGETVFLRLPREILDEQEREMGEAPFAAQYLQAPLISTSQIIDARRLHLVDEPFTWDTLQYVVQSIDTAMKGDQNSSYSVVSTWGFNGTRWCLLDVFRDRVEFDRLISAVLLGADKWKPDLMLIEDAALGRPLSIQLTGKVPWRRLIPATLPKGERLAAATPKLYCGEIVFPRHERFVEPLMRELAQFPGKYDDQVDTISQFCNFVSSSNVQSLVEKKRYGRVIANRRPSNPARRQF